GRAGVAAGGPGPRGAGVRGRRRRRRTFHGGTKARETAAVWLLPARPSIEEAPAGFAHLHDNYGPEARYAVAREAELPTTAHEREIARGLEYGLPGAESLRDRSIPTFSRGELPHFAGINTFLKAPYLEDVRRCGEYDVAVLGAPFDGGTTYRSGTRFGPQGIRKISALYGPYSFELGVDLRESITIGDLGDVFTIPGNIEKTFDQITKAVSHVYASGAFPVVLGGDHSIGYPTVRGVAPHLNGGNLGIIHFD